MDLPIERSLTQQGLDAQGFHDGRQRMYQWRERVHQQILSCSLAHIRELEKELRQANLTSDEKGKLVKQLQRERKTLSKETYSNKENGGSPPSPGLVRLRMISLLKNKPNWH